ncbi:MAG: chemotaxis protein CheB [Candidatus Aminicenantes bacterium]|nr:chemotaxis protein CheB [Candidatus Aminicenantes bacterium]NIM80368.1 chemotaxis protein CheB [Candidatus Aminicenantes bacterium]NIN19755.1 chemotaxis protein CheB [Candidatus Aminicenantes bacterium]NIN43637.1 chemotaxis protein CheB [Candidatus Aminicenantes bacterium]NIN86382.1 chemotaxis protein CheB [Candidatus Aminicenantes bacterium]
MAAKIKPTPSIIPYKGRYKYKCIAIGVSAGGMHALCTIIPALPAQFPLPVIVIQHLSPHSDNYTTRHLDKISKIRVKEVDEKEKILPGIVYMGPPNYHVLVEEDETFSLSVEERINWARPSIDVLFESAADVYGPALIGVILTGSNNDGSRGLKKIKEEGGLTLVQDPHTAEVDGMPLAAIETTKVDHILKLEEIAPLLVKLANQKVKVNTDTDADTNTAGTGNFA